MAAALERLRSDVSQLMADLPESALWKFVSDPQAGFFSCGGQTRGNDWEAETEDALGLQARRLRVAGSASQEAAASGSERELMVQSNMPRVQMVLREEVDFDDGEEVVVLAGQGRRARSPPRGPSATSGASPDQEQRPAETESGSQRLLLCSIRRDPDAVAKPRPAPSPRLQPAAQPGQPPRRPFPAPQPDRAAAPSPRGGQGEATGGVAATCCKGYLSERRRSGPAAEECRAAAALYLQELQQLGLSVPAGLATLAARPPEVDGELPGQINSSTEPPKAARSVRMRQLSRHRGGTGGA